MVSIQCKDILGGPLGRNIDYHEPNVPRHIIRGFHCRCMPNPLHLNIFIGLRRK
ncbi:MAG: hypothetical protein HXS53_01440 [Theionarchaea archaeon]|nr:hypothetical protein [Theionarchaea archaeon]